MQVWEGAWTAGKAGGFATQPSALSTHLLARQTDGVVPALAPPNQIRLSHTGNASGIQHYPWKNAITIPTHPTQMTQLLPLTAWVELLLQRK